MKKLILFVHGLGGGATTTWGKFPELISADIDFDEYDVAHFTYSTSLLGVFNRVPKIQDIAALLKTDIDELYYNYEQICLVAHSLGGLVVKKYLVDELLHNRNIDFIHKAIYYAVPHNGATLANIAKIAGNEQIVQSATNSDFIQFLNEAEANSKIDDQIESLYAVGVDDSVVPPQSAQRFWGNDRVIKLPNGHMDIVKPNSEEDRVFIIFKNFILGKKRLLSSMAKFKQFYSSQFSTIFTITQDAFNINDIYMQLSIIEEDKINASQASNQSLGDEGVHFPLEGAQSQKRILDISKLLQYLHSEKISKCFMLGEAGVGKTTVSMYVAHCWATDKDYEFYDLVIYYPLRHWDDNLDIFANICKYYEISTAELSADVKRQRALYIFDGYDEFNGSRKALYDSVVDLSSVIFTSRSYSLEKKYLHDFKVFENIGFSEENIKSYICKIIPNKLSSAALQQFIQNNSNIGTLANIPLLLDMICALWIQDNEIFHSSEELTTARLYYQIVLYMLDTYAKNKGYDAIYREREWDAILSFLGKIAFEALGNNQINIDRKILLRSFSDETSDKEKFFEEKILKCGFLKSHRQSNNIWRNTYEFIHLTFRDYFAAYYTVKQNDEFIKRATQKYEYCPYAENYLSFLAGLFGIDNE